MARYDKDISNNKLHGKENPSVATTRGLSVEITPAIDDFENGDGVGEIIKLGGIGYHATPGATLPGACYWLYQSGHTTAGNDYPNAPTWWQTDSDDPNFGGNDIIAIAMGTVPVIDGMLIRGIARIPDAYVNGTPVLGKEIFISESDHKIDFTAPSPPSEFVRVIGYCLDKNDDGDVLIHFDPDRTWLGHSALAGIDDQTSSNDDQITIKDAEVVINEDSDDLDFRVETNATATALVVDGGGDLVKIDAAQALHLKDLGGAANTPASGYGVMYVNGDTPYFKTDGGVATSMIGVESADISGTPADNQISVWTDADTLEGTSNLTFDTTKSLNVITTPAIGNFSDDTGEGEVINFGSGTTVAGKLYYLHTTGAWTAVDADAVATGADQLLAIALGTAPSTHGMLIKGIARIDTANTNGTPVVGKPVYVSTTVAEFDFTAPSGSGDFVRIVGYCLATTGGDILIIFSPSTDWIEIS